MFHGMDHPKVIHWCFHLHSLDTGDATWLIQLHGPQPMGQPAWLFSIVKVPKVPKENNTSKEMRH